MQTTGESVKIDLSVTVPVVESLRMAEALKIVLSLAGHEIRPVNDEGEELYSLEEVFPDSRPGSRLKGIRLREGLTQKEMAEHLGIRQNHISAMENGARSISLEMAKRAGKKYNVSYKIFL
jgi:DNA-binding XRE family transcriptional regulator